jgi:Archaeal fructose-1,6-bisphosphatase and related enzymes of inositol monophosphatase family
VKPEIEAAVEAGKIASDLMDSSSGGEFSDVESKSSESDIVTEVDRSCQESIISMLNDRFPDSGFLAEEDEVNSSGNPMWIIDPIDGTLNFSTGFPYFCSSIGVEESGQVIGGAVASPQSALGEYYFAHQGNGAFRCQLSESPEQGSRVSVSDSGISGGRIALDFSRRVSPVRSFDSSHANLVIERGGAIMRPGAAALNLCMLARGSINGMVAHVHRWDYAAGKVIVEEAGGQVSTAELENGTTEVLAWNGDEEVGETLREISRGEHQ